MSGVRASGSRAVREASVAAAGRVGFIPLYLFYRAFPCKTGRNHLRSGRTRCQPHRFSAIFASAAELSLAICPFGPTAYGNDSAFQLASSSVVQVLPSSRLISDPLAPTAIHALSAADQPTPDRYP